MSTMAEIASGHQISECHQISIQSHPALSPVKASEEGIETLQGADGEKSVPWKSSSPNRG